MSIARAVLTGTLEQDPEKRFTPQNVAVTTCWLVVPGRTLPSGQPAPAIRVKLTCWRGMAETAGQLTKDQVVMVEGKLMLPSYQGQDGVQRKHFEVDVNSLSVLPGGLPTALQAAAGGATANGPVGQAPMAQPQPVPAYSGGGHAATPAMGAHSDDLFTEEDIPF
jgi:single-stranded DNA-binding protein